MNRYEILKGKKIPFRNIKPVIEYNYRKIIIGGCGSGKTSFLISEIISAINNGLNNIEVFIGHLQVKDYLRRGLGENYKKCYIHTINRENFSRFNNYAEAVFFDDLMINKFLLKIIDFSQSPYIKRIVITCDLIEFVVFIAKKQKFWKHINATKWDIIQLHE